MQEFLTFRAFASLVQIPHGAAAAKTFQILKTWKVSKTLTAVSSFSTWTLYPITFWQKGNVFSNEMHLIGFLT